MIAAESKLEASRNKSHCKEYSTIFDAFYRIQLDDRCIGILTNECFIVCVYGLRDTWCLL